MRHRSAPAAALAVVCDQTIVQRLLRVALQSGVEARAYGQAAGIDGIGAIAPDQRAADFFGEPLAIRDRIGFAIGGRCDRLRGGGLLLVRGDGAILAHAGQHEITPAAGRIRVVEWIVGVGRLGQGAEQGRFGQGQAIKRLIEIGLRRCGDTIAAHAKIDFIEIELEHTLFAERLIDADREDRFLDLAGQRQLVADQHVLGKLLGDGGRALRAAALAPLPEIMQPGAQDGHRVDAVMGPEGVILGGDECLLHLLGDGADRHEDAPFGRVFRQQLRIIGVQPRDHLRIVMLERIERRQAGRVVLVANPAGDGAGRAEHENKGEQRPDHLAERTRRVAPWRSRGRRRVGYCRRSRQPVAGAQRPCRFAGSWFVFACHAAY